MARRRRRLAARLRFLNDYSPRLGARQDELAKTKGRRLVSRVLWSPAGRTRPGRQPFRWAPGCPGALATSPQASAEPASIACLFGVAPDGGCRVSPLGFGPRTRLCGPVRHVAVPGGYPASRSAEPGLSSVPPRKTGAQRLPGRLPDAILPREGAGVCFLDAKTAVFSAA